MSWRRWINNVDCLIRCVQIAKMKLLAHGETGPKWFWNQTCKPIYWWGLMDLQLTLITNNSKYRFWTNYLKHQYIPPKCDFFAPNCRYLTKIIAANSMIISVITPANNKMNHGSATNSLISSWSMIASLKLLNIILTISWLIILYMNTFERWNGKRYLLYLIHWIGWQYDWIGVRTETNFCSSCNHNSISDTWCEICQQKGRRASTDSYVT